ncbi:MAG: pyruvate dehydrogenase (acetyl-transferring), homodimeric type [Calditrichaeota bacterium]|nr:MAG: pyruvate dehydrogenase (acetyl-transferring), homodimeric type [Calditrichota bacterium]
MPEEILEQYQEQDQHRIIGVNGDIDAEETAEWLEAFEGVLQYRGAERAFFLLNEVMKAGFYKGVPLPFYPNTPYINTIPVEKEPPYPGDRQIERRIKSIIRWNAMALVVRANRLYPGIGGHISTYASAATLYEVGFNHFFRAKSPNFDGDLIYIQGHASPGIYARAYLEGRISDQQMENFRRELAEGGGLSSYPHPWLMPDFWEFPTVSMGLSPISAIYQARFARYLQDRGIKDTSQQRIWAFLGDGETDEPETLGAITLAAREKLDNLIFVVNCNLQRLDGPVRGNGNIIQELETVFRGAGWNVIKVIWGSDWDPFFNGPYRELLIRRFDEVVDGHLQKYIVEPGSYIRQHFWGKYPELLKLVEHLSDEQLKKLRLGGHDPVKMYAAYKAATEHEGAPTVILARTIKGYGLGEAGEGKNITHQQKKLNEQELRQFRDRFDIPIPDDKLPMAPFYRPPENSPEIQYLKDRRSRLGGFVPSRRTLNESLEVPPLEYFAEFLGGSEREVSTTMAFVRLLSQIIKHPKVGYRIVPIVPDEARTFGMEFLFRQVGIYSHVGQKYEPVDADTFLYYKEARNGQILEEGITEAGSMASFTAAGTAYANYGVDMIPFFIFYSMFGFQRVGDLIWAFGDQRGRGFLIGGTAGRTTLMGEGLQHQDGHSHLLASTVPNCISYDPAWAYEIAVIIQHGLTEMYTHRKDVFYYLTVHNENYPMPPMPKGVEEGIIRGLYKFSEMPAKPKGKKKARPKAHIFGSGSILREALRAQQILAEKYHVAADVWSATSYNQLHREALEVERWNMLHPTEEPRKPYIAQVMENEEGPVVAASDYMKTLPDQIARWVPGGIFSLGTDGFGRSDTREALRRFFEVDAESIAIAVLYQLARRGDIKPEVVQKAIKELGVDPEKANPMIS